MWPTHSVSRMPAHGVSRASCTLVYVGPSLPSLLWKSVSFSTRTTGPPNSPSCAIASLRSFVTPSAGALPFRCQAHGFVFDQLGNGEAVVHLRERQILERDAGLCQSALPSHAAAFEFQHIAARHR